MTCSDVSTLALLDHVNIVDLYSAWIEKKKSFGSVTNVIYICMKECARYYSEIGKEFLKLCHECCFSIIVYIFDQVPFRIP